MWKTFGSKPDSVPGVHLFEIHITFQENLLIAI
jgi:hypothetical protein